MPPSLTHMSLPPSLAEQKEPTLAHQAWGLQPLQLDPLAPWESKAPRCAPAHSMGMRGSRMGFGDAVSTQSGHVQQREALGVTLTFRAWVLSPWRRQERAATTGQVPQVVVAGAGEGESNSF